MFQQILHILGPNEEQTHVPESKEMDNLVVPKQQILEMKEQPEHMTDQGISRTSERRWLPYLSLGKPLPMQFRYNYNLKLYLP